VPEVILAFLLASGGGPPLEDAHRFPWPAAECSRRWQAAHRHSCWVQANRPDPAWRDDARWRAECWSALDDAKRALAPGACDYQRRRGSERLAELKALVGEGDYQLGRMPDYLPAHRFYPRPYWEAP
jgi:hypothetical protein